MPSVSKKPDPSPDDLTFEDALRQVEDIIERIESGKVGLEQSIAEYERGARLIRRCREVLGRAEQRVQELTVELLESGGSGPSGRAPGSSAPGARTDESRPSE